MNGLVSKNQKRCISDLSGNTRQPCYTRPSTTTTKSSSGEPKVIFDRISRNKSITDITRFCYRFVQGNKCRKDNCKFLHHQPGKARYLIDGEVVNHVYDHRLAIELLSEHAQEIRESYKSKPVEGEHGFLPPIAILDKVGPAGSRKRYYSTSQHDLSQEMVPRNGRSTNSVDYEDDEDEEKLEYRPKVPPSESYSNPDHKEKSETFSKNYLSESPVEGKSRKISDFDHLIDPPQSIDGQIYPSDRNFPLNSESNFLEQDHDYEDLIADIAGYVHADQGSHIWECTETDQDPKFNFYDDLMKQNLRYLNDINEISQEDTAHYIQSSSESLAVEPPLAIQDHCRAWGLDEIEEEVVAQSGVYSSLNFVCSTNKELLSFLEAPKPHQAKEEENFFRNPKNILVTNPNNAKAPLFESKSKEEKGIDRNVKEKTNYSEFISPLLKEKNISEDLFSKADNLVLISQKSENKPKNTNKADAAKLEEEKLNIFTSRAQKKKEREAKKKKNRKIKQEEHKLNANQDVSLQSDSIDVSCIQKKQSKFEHSDEEKEICSMIEDPISQTYLKNGNFPIENPLIKAVLDEQHTNPQELTEEKQLPEEMALPESNADEDEVDKKGKKKKKKKKKPEAKPVQLGNKNKLSGFQEKLLQEQMIKEEQLRKQPPKEAKIEPPPPKPTPKMVEPTVDFEFQLAQSLNKARGPVALESIFKMMELVDTSQTSRVVIDSYSCDHACKFLFAACAK
jgi:hypothetical protein